MDKRERLFLDTEFNGFGGELISMALVGESGAEWYEVLHYTKPEPWVAENVIPKLGKAPTNRGIAQGSLARFLLAFPAVTVVADWPEDIAHFCQFLITGPGTRLNTPDLSFEIIRVDAPSEVPHNALADARGIRDAVLALTHVARSKATSTREKAGKRS